MIIVIYVDSSNLIGLLLYSMALFNAFSTHAQTSLVTFLKMIGKFYSGLSRLILVVRRSGGLIGSKCFMVNITGSHYNLLHGICSRLAETNCRIHLYIIKCLLHTPFLNIRFITTLGWVVINHDIQCWSVQ